MRKFDFWKFMVYKEDLFVSPVMFLRQARRLWGLAAWKYVKTGDRLIKELSVKDGRIIILLNGPSVKVQPLENLIGEDVICVNQGFRLPQYGKIKPKYHLFVDPKLRDGIWDITWIDEILKLNPDVTFVMPAAWAKYSKFQKLIKRQIRIIWIRDRIHCHGASGAAFQLAWALGYKTVYFTGYEASAFPSMLLKQVSHFYGNDADEAGMTMEDVMKGYYTNALHFREVLRDRKIIKRLGIRMVNLTEGGLIEAFERQKFEDAFPHKNK